MVRLQISPVLLIQKCHDKLEVEAIIITIGMQLKI